VLIITEGQDGRGCCGWDANTSCTKERLVLVLEKRRWGWKAMDEERCKVGLWVRKCSEQRDGRSGGDVTTYRNCDVPADLSKLCGNRVSNHDTAWGCFKVKEGRRKKAGDDEVIRLSRVEGGKRR
jgi:hypothetical protein